MTRKKNIGIGATIFSAGALGVFGIIAVPSVSNAVLPSDTQQQKASAAQVDPETPGKAQPSGAEDPQQKLVFSDEFNGSSLDTSKWTTADQERTAHSGLRWWYKPENVSVGKGALNLGISKLGENKFAGGHVDSAGKYEYKYGTVEFRMHAPPTQGHLAAAWMMPEGGSGMDDKGNGTGRDGTEMDLVETASNSDTFPVTIHYDGYGADHKSSGDDAQAPNLHKQEYHTYGLKWAPDSLKFLYDGKVVRTVTDPKLVSQVKEHPIMSSEILSFAEGDVRKAPLDSSSDTRFDYVRVWQGK